MIKELNLWKKERKDQCWLKKALYIIYGSENPKFFVKFMEHFDFDILHQKGIGFKAILDILLNLLEDEAAHWLLSLR